jgi:aminopeptidase N
LGRIDTPNNAESKLKHDGGKSDLASFINKSLSSNVDSLSQYYDSFWDESVRYNYEDVVLGLGFLHHPFRNESSLKYLLPSLHVLSEMGQNLPVGIVKSYLDAILKGYSSGKAEKIVRSFLLDNPDLNPYFQQQVLQSADMLFRGVKHSM